MRQNYIMIALLCLILISNLGIAAALFLQRQEPPAAAAVQVVTATPPASSSASLPTATAAPLILPTAQPQPAVAAYCGKTGSIRILVIGSDAMENRFPPGADLIRLVKVDFDQKRVVVFAFLRDLWVTTPSLAAQGVNATTLGQVYDYGYKMGMLDSPRDDRLKVVMGTQMVAQTLYENYGILAERYVTVRLADLPPMIDTLGGLSVNVPVVTVTDRYVFRPGVQLLNGAMTVSYIRYLGPTDWDRIVRQNLVLEAARQKLLLPATTGKLPELFMQFSNAIITDLDAGQVASLACVVKDSDNVKITQDGVRPEMTSAGPQKKALLLNLPAAKDLLRQLSLLP